MNTTTFRIPIELNSTGEYTVGELRDKLMSYAMILISMPKAAVKKQVKTESVQGHSAWVKSMAKFRRLNYTDDKETLMQSLDERFK